MATYRWLALWLILLLSGPTGCAPRPASEVLTPVAKAPRFTDKVRLLVATTRERGSKDDPNAFGVVRASVVNHAALTISIPRRHVAGQIEWPDQAPPDPALHFLTTERGFLEQAEFLREVEQRARTSTADPGSVLVFIHGFNTLYEEAVYRFAQIVHDSGFKGTAVLFAWPSRGKAPLYLADRDASTYSRDYLEQTLLDIAGLKSVREVNIIAHSMGNWLAVETLRQARMKGHGDFKGKLGDVVLASPDIDVTVFRTQLDVIAPLRRPITILVSGDDKALALSSTLAGGVQRVGQVSINDARALAFAQHYNLRVVDLTKVDDGTGSHHSKFAVSGAVVRAIGRGLSAEENSSNSQSGLIAAISDVGTSLLKVPTAIVGGALPQQ